MYKMYRHVGSLINKMNRVALQADTSVIDALDVMEKYGIPIVSVKSEDVFIGTFSQSDFEKKVLRQNRNPRFLTLFDVMTINPPTINENNSVREAYDTMLAYQWDYMPVLNGQNVRGILSIQDIR